MADSMDQAPSLSGHAGWPRLALRGKAHAGRMLAKLTSSNLLFVLVTAPALMAQPLSGLAFKCQPQMLCRSPRHTAPSAVGIAVMGRPGIAPPLWCQLVFIARTSASFQCARGLLPVVFWFFDKPEHSREKRSGLLLATPGFPASNGLPLFRGVRRTPSWHPGQVAGSTL